MNNETRKETQVLPKDVRYVGADDLTLPLFENQYPVQPMGVSYNSYLILDEKIAVIAVEISHNRSYCSPN